MDQNGEIDEEFITLDVRLGQFLNILTVLQDYMTGKYIPSIELKAISDDDYRMPATFAWTIMSLLYSFFFSLVDTHSKGLNAFRIWRLKFPTYLLAINAVESRVLDVLPELKKFRDKLGFHGSRNIKEEEIGYELLTRHGSIKILNVIQHFISLAISFQTLANSSDHGSATEAKERIGLLEKICRIDSGYDFDSEELLATWFS